MVVRFWEARVAPGCLDAALAWTTDVLHERLRAANGYVSGEVFVADEVVASATEGEDQPARIVLLTRWIADPGGLDESLPADGPIARAHGWYFRSV